ncbi:hypothetical protein LTR70_000324 [Exophiala xenobiotica]|uniref:Uncharacterized protein n=1 Tax=Lithohypha guttulata TaxID=1690604 RepID=A0ABR0KQL9_9EURO|nr:hypothetical protein LTR24_000027 [Lithohypha guttulata]KAK5330494.1 hypothetical protein LTR70_000324 [Exophiala xenobiotica]
MPFISEAPLSPPDSVLRKSSRTPKPARHGDGTKVGPLKVTKRTTPPKSAKSEPLLKLVLKLVFKKGHEKACTDPPTPPPNEIVALLDYNSVLPEKPASKKRKSTSTQLKAGASRKRAKTQAQANANEAQPRLETELITYDLTPANPTHGLDALFLAGELRKQQEAAQECYSENLMCRRFLNKRMKDLHETRDLVTNDKELALLQSNLSTVEDGLRRYPRHHLLRHDKEDWSSVPEAGCVAVEQASQVAVRL